MLGDDVVQQVAVVDAVGEAALEVEPGRGGDVEVHGPADPRLEQVLADPPAQGAEGAQARDVPVEVDQEPTGGGVAELGRDLVADAGPSWTATPLSRAQSRVTSCISFSRSLFLVVMWSMKST